MPTIYEIANETGLSLRTLRTLEKRGYLKATASADPIADAARANLKKGNRLTALQQLHLLRNPEARDYIIKGLINSNNYRYDFEIDSQLDSLGNALNEGAPWDISSAIELAARREPSAVDKISNWLFSFIQVSEYFDKGATRDHAFIAVRLLAEVPEHSLVDLSKKVQACLWQCRRSAQLSDCWKLNEKGQTIYFRPNKKALANFDL